MNRAEAIPVDGSRSTTEPPDGHGPATPPPSSGQAPPQVVTPARPASGGNSLVVRPPAPALSRYPGHRRPDSTPDRLPVRRAEPALPIRRTEAGLPVRHAEAGLPVRHTEAGLPEPWTRPPADGRTANTAVTRRTGRRRGAVPTRRVVAL
ncbi:hypothetical protein [Actinoplanes sp. NPDC026670]|uniref:hypothetical protein n=1 Tax=Actinoplanes sp. NPDC026670 TaxID=3154700 RepID=UPI0034052D19